MVALVRQVYTDDDWAFVGCPARLGHITRRGPITGQNWVITPLGVWIDAQDAAELVEIIEKVWCFRSESYLDLHTVLYLVPSTHQLATKPEGIHNG